MTDLKSALEPPKVPDQNECAECRTILPGRYRCGQCLTAMHLVTAHDRDQLRSRVAELEAQNGKLRGDIAKLEGENGGWIQLTGKYKQDSDRLSPRLAEARAEVERLKAHSQNDAALFRGENEQLSARIATLEALIKEKDGALQSALNAFEKNWAIDWGDIEKALALTPAGTADKGPPG